MDPRYRDINGGGRGGVARLPRDGMNLSPLLCNIVSACSAECSSAPLLRSLHAIYSYLKDRPTRFRGLDEERKRKRKEREWEEPNFIPRRASPRNLLPSKLQRGILPSPKDPAYLDEHGLLFPRRVFDRCLPGIKAVNGGGSAGYPPWRGWKVIGRDEGRCLRASSSEIIFERWNFVVDKTISKGFSIVGSLWGINLGLIYYRFVIDS